MPAPEDLKAQSPGDPLATMTPLASSISNATGGNPDANEISTAAAQAPVYQVKHNGGKRWLFLDAEGKELEGHTFTGTKAEAIVEAKRLTDGGEIPTIDPDEEDQDAVARAPVRKSVTDVDPTTIKQAVMTSEGWLCPEPPAEKA